MGEVRIVVTSSQVVTPGQAAKAGLADSATTAANSIERCLFKSNLVFGFRWSVRPGRGPNLPAFTLITRRAFLPTHALAAGQHNQIPFPQPDPPNPWKAN